MPSDQNVSLFGDYLDQTDPVEFARKDNLPETLTQERTYGGERTAQRPVQHIDASVAGPMRGPSSPIPNIAPPQPNWVVRSAQLQAEYVSGGGYVFLANYIRSLPHYIDDTTRDLGDDLYERMLLDPQVASSIRLLKLSVLTQGIRLEPGLTADNLPAEPPEEEIRSDLPHDIARGWRDNDNPWQPAQSADTDQAGEEEGGQNGQQGGQNGDNSVSNGQQGGKNRENSFPDGQENGNGKSLQSVSSKQLNQNGDRPRTKPGYGGQGGRNSDGREERNPWDRSGSGNGHQYPDDDDWQAARFTKNRIAKFFDDDGNPVEDDAEKLKKKKAKEAKKRKKLEKKKKEQEKKRERMEDDIELAEEICRFCQNCLDNTERPFLDILYEMLDGLALGNKVAEQIYELRDDEDGNKRLFLKNLKVKPRQSTAFVVDAYMNVIGLLGLLPGQGYPVLTGSVVGDPTKLPNLLPREKFFVFTWAPTNGDPRGTSLLRSIYNSWWLKMQTWGEYAKYLAQFAGPSMIGYTAPNAQPVPVTDHLGNPIPGAPLITPEQAMLSALLSFKNGSAVVFPNGAKVEPINMGGDGTAFRNAISQFNAEISKGILCQTLATEEGIHQARAASETHQDVLDMVVLHIKQLLAAFIYRDVLFHLVRYNWGLDVARRLTPKVHMVAVESHNWSKDASAVASLTQSGYLHKSQLHEMDARLGLPRRQWGSEDEMGPAGKGEEAGAGGPGGPGGGPGGPGGDGGDGGLSALLGGMGNPDAKDKPQFSDNRNQRRKVLFNR